MYFPNTITTTLLALLSTTATALPQTVSTNPPGSSGGNTIGEWTFTVQQHKDMANNCTVENATAIYYGEMAPYGLTSTCWHVIPMAGNGVSRGTHNCTNRFSYQIGGVHARPGQNLMLQQQFDHYNKYGGITYKGWSNMTLYTTDYSGHRYEASLKVPILR